MAEQPGDKPLVKEARCKCPKCKADLVMDVVKHCVTEPVQAVYETQIQLHVDPQGALPLGEDEKE